MKINIIFKDNEHFELKADEIKVTTGHITLTEKKNRFWTTIKLSEVKEYTLEN